jgi:hypothetical protein
MDRLEPEYIQQLRSEFSGLCRDALQHLQSLMHVTGDRTRETGYKSYWTYATEEERHRATVLQKRVAEFGAKLMEAVGHSPLLDSIDADKVRRQIRALASALVLRRYVYRPTEEVEDRGKVYGMRPAEHYEEDANPQQAEDNFNRAAHAIIEKIVLIAPLPENLAGAIVSSQTPGVVKSRPNTAFIIMQINEGIPKLEDTKNTIKAVFKEFGIDAVRADEIEHSGVITQKILDEIATSEFLIADLTGERPSVYYEVGYAHALGKRPILYREKGSPLHFDLLVHNVPEYKNGTELRKMLTERLKAVTGKNPKN